MLSLVCLVAVTDRSESHTGVTRVTRGWNNIFKELNEAGQSEQSNDHCYFSAAKANPMTWCEPKSLAEFVRLVKAADH